MFLKRNSLQLRVKIFWKETRCRSFPVNFRELIRITILQRMVEKCLQMQSVFIKITETWQISYEPFARVHSLLKRWFQGSKRLFIKFPECSTLREKCLYSEFFWSVSLGIQSKCGKIRTRKIPNTNTFHAVQGISESTTFQKYLW